MGPSMNREASKENKVKISSVELMRLEIILVGKWQWKISIG